MLAAPGRKPPDQKKSGMEPSFQRYIWTHTRRQQLWILFIVAISMLPYYLAFDLPKQIVNGPIMGTGFEMPGQTQMFNPTIASTFPTTARSASSAGWSWAGFRRWSG